MKRICLGAIAAMFCLPGCGLPPHEEQAQEISNGTNTDSSVPSVADPKDLDSLRQGVFAASCIERRVVDTSPGWVTLYNHCGVAKNVKVIVKYGYDSPCKHLAAGSSYWWYWETGWYSSTIAC
jgi:hypothetical protein